ncbi:enoyl-CoA-hydratase DpgB [Kitasatospora sp. NPDC087861]|uniref:enoyl-CoA-hydratase DpgB n=1 Tax=Kitasatospora sp. NPDC087861 TaxID=3364070 RepID=UPI00380FD513
MTHTPEPLLIDGGRPLSPETVQALNALCDRAEDADGHAPVVLRVSGAPTAPTATPPLTLVNKWERALRRLERLERPTVALVGGDTGGDCGGTAVEALLTTDYRIAHPATRLLPPAGPDGVWPGMALHRLANQAGAAATRQVVLFGTAVPTWQALTMHLLDELADDPAAALADAADLLAAAGPGLSIRRQLMLDATTTGHEEALGRHLAACDRVLRRAAAEAVGPVPLEAPVEAVV